MKRKKGNIGRKTGNKDEMDKVISGKGRIRLYRTPGCMACDKAADFLKSKKVLFTSIDVTKSRKAFNELVERTGQPSVPVLDIDNSIIVGYDETVLYYALKIGGFMG